MIFRVIGILVSVAGAASNTGCAPGRVDLFDSGALRLERVPDKRGHYRDIHAYRTDDGISVIGYVRRSSLPAHVHVQFQNSAGQTLASTKVNVRRVLRSSRVRHAWFEAAISTETPDGSVVQVQHHVGQCEGSGLSDPAAGADLKGKVPWETT